jgi:hypothetical protein
MAQEYDITQAVPSIISLIELVLHAYAFWLSVKETLRQHGFGA